MCLTCFKCMLLIKHKMMLFRKVASARPVGWMTAGGALQNGIRAKVSTLSLDGPDKWSWTDFFFFFEKKLCLEDQFQTFECS
jgi:hypothetical protein